MVLLCTWDINIGLGLNVMNIIANYPVIMN